MALTEEKVLVSVEVGIENGTAQAKWINRIKRDDEIVSEAPHRCAYTAEQKEQFLADVEGASDYIAILGW